MFLLQSFGSTDSGVSHWILVYQYFIEYCTLQMLMLGNWADEIANYDGVFSSIGAI